MSSLENMAEWLWLSSIFFMLNVILLITHTSAEVHLRYQKSSYLLHFWSNFLVSPSSLSVIPGYKYVGTYSFLYGNVILDLYWCSYALFIYSKINTMGNDMVPRVGCSVPVPPSSSSGGVWNYLTQRHFYYSLVWHVLFVAKHWLSGFVFYQYWIISFWWLFSTTFFFLTLYYLLLLLLLLLLYI